jgi:hypothetical protein
MSTGHEKEHWSFHLPEKIHQQNKVREAQASFVFLINYFDKIVNVLPFQRAPFSFLAIHEPYHRLLANMDASKQ